MQVGEEGVGREGPALSCFLDNSPLATCSSPLTLTGLNPGPHVLQVCRGTHSNGGEVGAPDCYAPPAPFLTQVEARDEAGNVGKSPRYRWRVASAPLPKLSANVPPGAPCSGPFNATVAWPEPVDGFGPEGLVLQSPGGEAELRGWQVRASCC